MAAAKKKVEVEVVVEATPETVEVVEEDITPVEDGNTPKKYRCDFASWKEYNEYKGAKG